jgi:putative nucleotidyltransferase with HDIG domain
MLDAMGDMGRVSLWTWGHLSRVARYALAFGAELGMRGESLLILHCAAMLHDIGKLSVPPELLDKRAPLARDEWYAITKHPVASSKMLRAQNLPVEVVSAAQSHHEWFNGSGYPLGLAGEAIPLAARLLSIADSYDAMSSDRPYRSALSTQRVREEIEKGAGEQFDPGLVRALLPLLEAGVDTHIPKLNMRVVADDPQLFAELFFAAHPLGWELEIWPPELSSELPAHSASRSTTPDLNREAVVGERTPDLTVVDERCVSRLGAGVLDEIEGEVLWIGSGLGTRRSVNPPLDLRDLHAMLNPSRYSGARDRKKADALRVLIADPYHLFRQVLRRCLDERNDMRVVTEVSTPGDFRHAVAEANFDVAVVASDLIAGTSSTSPLSLAGSLLEMMETRSLRDSGLPAVILVADEDLELYTRDAGDDHTFIHRGAPIEDLVDLILRVSQV